MFFRTAEVIEMVQVLYPVIAALGRTLQLVVLAVFRKDVSRLVVDMQRFVNLSIIAIMYTIFQLLLCGLYLDRSR